MASDVYPLPQAVRPIGTPYVGTHAKSFNVKGGSDNWESENAVDLPTPKGTPVYAVAGGTIGPQIGAQGGGRFAGLRLHLVTGNNEYFYAHLSKLAVHAGEQVQAGQLLGYSGVANGVAHLHFAAKNGDPRSAFGATFSSSATAPSPTPTSAATTAPTTAADQTVPGTGTSGPADTTAPPGPNLAEPPPPTAQPLPGGGVSLPGSVRIVAPQVADLWQQVASQNMVSPDTQALLANASLASGG